MHVLPELPFDKNEPDPVISEEGFEYHHGKHHQAYVNGLNNLIQDTAREQVPLETIIQNSRSYQNTPLFNCSAQQYNHRFSRNCISPHCGGKPKGVIAKLISKGFGDLKNFRLQFSNLAAGLFGSKEPKEWNGNPKEECDAL